MAWFHETSAPLERTSPFCVYLPKSGVLTTTLRFLMSKYAAVSWVAPSCERYFRPPSNCLAVVGLKASPVSVSTPEVGSNEVE